MENYIDRLSFPKCRSDEIEHKQVETPRISLVNEPLPILSIRVTIQDPS